MRQLAVAKAGNAAGDHGADPCTVVGSRRRQRWWSAVEPDKGRWARVGGYTEQAAASFVRLVVDQMRAAEGNGARSMLWLFSGLQRESAESVVAPVYQATWTEL